jgi:hypothetical protein
MMLAMATLISCQNDDTSSTTSTNESIQKSASSVKLTATSIVSSVTPDGTNVAANAIDASSTSRWSAYGDNVSLYLDMGKTVTLDYVK